MIYDMFKWLTAPDPGGASWNDPATLLGLACSLAVVGFLAWAGNRLFGGKK